MATVYKRGGKGKRGGRYYISYFDHRGQRVSRSARTTDKATAERIAAKLEADAALRRDGVIDPTLEGVSKESQRTIESHLADYEAKLRAADRTEKHVRYTRQFVEWICTFAGFGVVADITADGVHRYAQNLRDQGRSSRTIQSHLNAIKSFTKWLVEHHKLPRDPLAGVRTPNPDTDRRLERRTLLPSEWPLLRAATKAGPVRYGMMGTDRVLLYATAIQTGLRSNELRNLRQSKCFLNSNPPYITCKAGTTKNRREARQYIEARLARELRKYAASRSAKAPLFDLPHETNLARALRDDLEAARKAWLKDVEDDASETARRNESDFLKATNHAGEYFDFHSLRHTCGAWLAMAGEHPKVIQTVMRHSSITLTMDTYGHLFPGQEADAANRFSEMLNDSCEREAGDEQGVVGQQSAAHLQRAGFGLGLSDAIECDGQVTDDGAIKTPNSQPCVELGDSVRHRAEGDASSGGGTRTHRRNIFGAKDVTEIGKIKWRKMRRTRCIQRRK
ncbi:MAG: site-specific integrase [Planctomycetes bacterium]|nr:site-specific integrase [Planctomycetota bacterium]